MSKTSDPAEVVTGLCVDQRPKGGEGKGRGTHRIKKAELVPRFIILIDAFACTLSSNMVILLQRGIVVHVSLKVDGMMA